MQTIMEDIMGVRKLVMFADSENFLNRLTALSQPPDVIPLDIHIKPIDGFTLLQQIRSLQALRKTPIATLNCPSFIRKEICRMMPLLDKRIFYIEDDVKNRAVIQTLLERAGAKVDFEQWGVVEDVLTKLETFEPDMILLDLMFPRRVSGYEIFDHLRQHEQFHAIPIVAVSASDPAVEIPRTRARGFTGFIGKPIDLRLFPKQITTILNGTPIWYAA